jgi:mannose-1-phosphate guanylyltransferase
MEHGWAVIMAGGVGSRFWPLSRRARPKQLLDLLGSGTMLSQTSERIGSITPLSRQLVVTGEVLGDQVRALFPDMPHDNILEEPTGRNTAAAIGWAAIHIRRRDPNAVLMVLPSDHHVVDVARYCQTCEAALSAAQEGRIITLGIPITRPETGYGYIERGDRAEGQVFDVKAFKEKPDLETALRYLSAGHYFWNAGMFFMPAQLVIDELTRFEPELMAALEALNRDNVDQSLVRSVYPGLKSISIDYAVMERTQHIGVIPGDFGWSDVGSWRSLWDFRPDGASTFSGGDVIELDGTGNVLFADEGLVATVGISDTIVIHTKDATLVCPREEAQRLREVVAALKEREKETLL